MTGIALLEMLVQTPSVSGEEATLADRLETLLAQDGFAVQRKGANLWFTLRGGDGPHLLLVSHIDTVPPCAGWTGDPYQLRREEGKLIGLGANDAKGCVAAMILAARAQRDSAPEGAVTFAFVAEEEWGGAGVRALLEGLPAIDAAIVGEPTGLEICIAQRGMLILRCMARGESAHVAHAELGENAIHKAARDIARLDAMTFPEHDSLGAVRAQTTVIKGGLARNQVPDQCEFFVDLRTTPNLDHEAIAAGVDAALESDVVIHSGRYLPVATDASEPIVRAALQASGHERGVGSGTTSDWAFLKGIPTVKVGPGDTNRSHRPNEYLLPAELEAGAAFYGRVMHGYFACREEAHV